MRRDWSGRLAGLALDDHLLGLVLARKDAQYGVARKSHSVVLAVAIRRAVQGVVEIHLALQAPHVMSECRCCGIVPQVGQGRDLWRSVQAVPVARPVDMLEAQSLGHAD